MELIPILSTIILVATIMTFILAIGAYVLYKIRERRGQTASVEYPSRINAELVSVHEYQDEPVQRQNNHQYYENPIQEQQRANYSQPVFVNNNNNHKNYDEDVHSDRSYSGKFVTYKEKSFDVEKPGDIKWR